jgi:hypothetical protein
MGRYTDTQTAWWSHKPAFIFLNKESRLQSDCSSFHGGSLLMFILVFGYLHCAELEC